jgi:hypothetical protein
MQIQIPEGGQKTLEERAAGQGTTPEELASRLLVWALENTVPEPPQE